jgi:hypothetical protein
MSPITPHDADRPKNRLATVDQHDHLVGFYDSEAFLTDSIVRFIAPGLVAGERAVVVATLAHREEIVAGLTAQGFAVAELTERGDLLLVDATELLSRLMVNGLLDRARFHELVGGLLDRAHAEGRTLRIFGEMVALLWEEGNVAGVLALESMWNELLRSQPVALFCAYPMRAFDREESEAAFHEVCDAHTVVLPSERYSDLSGADQRSRAVAVLQHEAIVGINERIALRQTLHQQEVQLQRLRALDRLRSRLVASLAQAPDTAGTGWTQGGVDTVRKTACRQVRTVLGALDCTFSPGAEVDGQPPGDVAHVGVAVSDGRVVHGVLRVQLTPDRHLDDDERFFLQEVADTLAVAFTAAG